MKRFAIFFALLALMVLLMAGCSVPKKQTSKPASAQNKDQVTALVNVNLIPMTEEKIIENQTVIVKGKKIWQIESANAVKLPEKAHIINGTGCYLMPGLVDMHAHIRVKSTLPLKLCIANGVTAIRNMDATENALGRAFIQDWRNEIEGGKRIGPKIYTTGPIIRGYEVQPWRYVTKHAKKGYDCIKIYEYFSEQDYRRTMSVAKEMKLYTVGHIPFSVGLNGVISEDMNEIAHIFVLVQELVDFDRDKNISPHGWWPYIADAFVKMNSNSLDFNNANFQQSIQERTKILVDKLGETKIVICTTLVMIDAATSEGKGYASQIFRGRKELATFFRTLCRDLFIELSQAGIPMVLGTDAGKLSGVVHGSSLHNEMRIVTDLGFSPYQAIAACTKNAANVAEAMTGKNDFGTIEIGKRADFILVNQNPLEDVSNIQDNRGVMAAGRWYSKSTLEDMISLSK
ncbi:MAG: amidohydrolase family protein [Desulfobacterales bacterium]|jgi:imidazolonepropionase-like amidohydrolase